MKIHPDCGYFNEEKYDEYSPYPGECEDCYRYDVCLEVEIKEKKYEHERMGKKEVEIACKREKPDRKEGEFDYGRACYESALKAFNCLMDDNHSGMSIGFTKNILNRLIDGKCLTPIEDTDDIWKYSFDRSDSAKVYQCKRIPSFFKEVYPDGSTKYNVIIAACQLALDQGVAIQYPGILNAYGYDIHGSCGKNLKGEQND